MALYWIIIFYINLFSLISYDFYASNFPSKKSLFKNNYIKVNFYLFFIFLIFFIGLRHQVGGDWYHYLMLFDLSKSDAFFDFISVSDPAYTFLNWFATQVNFGIYFVNLICALIFTIGLFLFSKSQPQPWLVLSIAFPYLILVVAMGYTRQGVAIGLIMVSLVSLQKSSIYQFIFYVFFAALFHKSAIIMLPIAFFAKNKSWSLIFSFIVIGILMYILLLMDHLDNLISGYIVDMYDSSGAFIRVLMNAVSAVFFLFFRKRFNISESQSSFWSFISYFSLFFVILLFISPSSTAVDRLALYFIPLQLFVFSRLPQVLGNEIHTQGIWVLVVLIYSFLVQFIWLFYAQHREFWIPYQFYPWLLLWT